MIILGIETSGILCSVAWNRDENCLLEYRYEIPNEHASLLGDLVHKGFTNLKIQPADIDLVAVATGPGSFTGLRIGMSYAKGFCFALNKPLTGISNFEVLAFQVQHDQNNLHVLIDARRGNFYCGTFYPGKESSPVYRILSLEEVRQLDTQNARFVVHKKINNINGLNLSNWIEADYDGKILCKIAQIKYKQAGTDDLNELEPNYLQPFAGVL